MLPPRCLSFLPSSQKALCPQAAQPGPLTCPHHSPWVAEGRGSAVPRLSAPCLPSAPAAGAAKGAAGTKRHFFQEPLPAFPPPSQSRAVMLGSAGGSWIRAKAAPGRTWLGWVLEPHTGHVSSSAQRAARPKHKPLSMRHLTGITGKENLARGCCCSQQPWACPAFPVQLGERLSSPDSPCLQLMRGFRHLSLGKGNPKHLSPSTPRPGASKK